MSKLSFKEYCRAKESLLSAGGSAPKVVVEYELKTYCKIPVRAGDEEREYVSLKPKDKIKVLWEYLDPVAPVMKEVSLSTENDTSGINFVWGNSKIISWLAKNTNAKRN